MSRLTLEPLRTLRSETKGQAGACPGRTRAIPCKVRAARRYRFSRLQLTATVTATAATNDNQQRPATARNARMIRANWDMSGLKNGRSFVGAAPRTWPTHHGRVPPRCPRIASTASDRHQQQPADLKLAQALSPRATHENTLVMRRSLVSDEDLGAGAPTALRGTLLKSAEAYH